MSTDLSKDMDEVNKKASNRKTVLIVTYYWPPAGGAPIQRILKFVKYLPEMGWDPIVLTVQNGDYPALDSSFEKEIPDSVRVYKSKIYEPHKLFKKLQSGNKKDRIDGYIISQKGGSLIERIGRYIRLNLFIPDARAGWFLTAVPMANSLIKKHQPQIIFISTPPHSVQLIGKKLSARHGIPWVADFRDPWLEIVYYQSVKRSKLTLIIDRYLEKRVLQSADAIVSISEQIIELFKSKAKLKNTAVIPNGYDDADFEQLILDPDDCFGITYTGVLSRERVPHTLLDVLKKLLDEGLIPDLKLRIVGKACEEFHDLINAHAGLKAKTEFIPFVPHNEALQYMLGAFSLLLVIDRVENNLGFLSGKVFDYIGARRPILAVGPTNGEANKMLMEADCGRMVHYDDTLLTRKLVLDLYQSFQSGKELFSFRGRERFSRFKLTEQLADVFTETLRREKSGS